MTGCDLLADGIVAALEEGRPGAVREVVLEHLDECDACHARAESLRALAEGLDPPMNPSPPGFVQRVMAEIRGEQAESSAYDRLPPAWQIAGAAALFTALAAVVLATGSGGSWPHRALTGSLEQAMGALGSLAAGLRGLWDAVVPGRGLPILVACAVIATGLNVSIAVATVRRKRRGGAGEADTHTLRDAHDGLRP